jgi:hypothetical protein
MKGFIGTGVNIAMYNLLEDEFEAHTLEDGKNAFIIEADDEKIDIWKNANDNNIVGFEVEDIVLNSIQIKFTKNRILEALRKKANEHIESEYPWHKQNNINELQGYSEEDKNSMWIFINSIRQETNNLEEQIKNALTLKQLKIIESEM